MSTVIFLESEVSSADAETDTELSTPTILHRRGLRKIVEDTPSRASSRGSGKGRKPVTSESSSVSSIGDKVPEKVIRGRPLVPGSPGVSRSGSRNSPRIDYRLTILDIFYAILHHLEKQLPNGRLKSFFFILREFIKLINNIKLLLVKEINWIILELEMKSSLTLQ